MSTDWKVSGTYFEACSCEAPCPCNFLGPPTEGECKVVLAWHIDHGRYEGIDLSGLNVAMFGYAPGHMQHAKWSVALYTDERASAEKANALARIFSGQDGGHLGALGPFIGTVLGVKAAAIEYAAEGRKRSMSIAGVADASVEAIEGQGGRVAEVHNAPFTVVPDVPLVASRASRMRYDDYGFKVDISGRNGYYSPFTYQG
ncbi:MAG: DUF1326 domain-containing protein [Rhodocyclaceae bacterium]|nr:DUF1326 domain-containing protein [Rhodocyclaceae bacterium]